MRFDQSNPIYGGANYPVRIESEVLDLEYEGRIPDALRGSLYRMTADPQFPPRIPPVVIEPDGLVNAFHFRGDRVDFVSRYVRTERLMRERAAGRSLFGMYRNRFTDDPLVVGLDRTTANTAFAEYNGHFLAMKEDGLPYEIDPDTLETIGRFDFDGQVSSSCLTAHPKGDPATGEFFTYGSQARGEGSCDIAYYAFDATGHRTAERWFEAPFASMVHDFAVTEHYAILPIMPATVDLDRMRAGGATYVWEPEKGAHVAIFRRDGSGEVRWFRLDPVFAFHTVNAFEEDGRIHLDVMAAPTFPMWWPTPAQIQALQTGQFTGDGFIAQLTRWTFDLSDAADGLTVTRLHDWDAEMPRIDERFATRRNRYAYYGADNPALPIAHGIGEMGVNHNSVARWDHDLGQLDSWYSGPGSSVGEPIFIPESPDAPEGQGYIAATVQRLLEGRSELVVLDARNLAAGPLATIHPPFRLKNGVHGMWRGS